MICPDCHGKKTITLLHTRTCERCKGTGQVPDADEALCTRDMDGRPAGQLVVKHCTVAGGKTIDFSQLDATPEPAAAVVAIEVASDGFRIGRWFISESQALRVIEYKNRYGSFPDAFLKPGEELRFSEPVLMNPPAGWQRIGQVREIQLFADQPNKPNPLYAKVESAGTTPQTAPYDQVNFDQTPYLSKMLSPFPPDGVELSPFPEMDAALERLRDKARQSGVDPDHFEMRAGAVVAITDGGDVVPLTPGPGPAKSDWTVNIPSPGERIEKLLDEYCNVHTPPAFGVDMQTADRMEQARRALIDGINQVLGFHQTVLRI